MYINRCVGKTSFALKKPFLACPIITELITNSLVSYVSCSDLVQILVLGIGVFFPSFFPQRAFFYDVFSLSLLLDSTDVFVLGFV